PAQTRYSGTSGIPCVRLDAVTRSHSVPEVRENLAGQGTPSHAEMNFLQDPPDFSLVLGGPIFQLFRRSHLTGDGLELLHRRLLTITLFTWLPLLLLSILGSSTGNFSRNSFLRDVEVHARFLVALPVLIAAELIVHSRIRAVVRRFVERR